MVFLEVINFLNMPNQYDLIAIAIFFTSPVREKINANENR